MNVDIIHPEQDSGRVRLIGAAKYIKVKLMKLVTLVTLERLTQALLIMAMIAFAIRILSASGIRDQSRPNRVDPAPRSSSRR